jgi:hypothetical protein
MVNLTVSPTKSTGCSYLKDTLVSGQPAKIRCVDIDGQTYVINRGPVTVVSLEDDWYEDVRDPERVIQAFKSEVDYRADLFTFWQRLPDTEPRFQYHMEWEEIAVLPVKSYDHWFKQQIKSRVRNQIRKAEKEGVTVRETGFDDDFVRGMTAIFNEAPVRQGRRFWHYGKSFETVKSQFSRYIHREHMIAADYQGEMIGLIMLGNAGRFGLTGQIISAIKHRDKATNNLLIAKAVEVCARLGLPYLCYLFWSGDSLAEFKRRCGFEPVRVPRYYVPLTARGRLALKLGAHRGWKAMIPEGLTRKFKHWRSRWYAMKETE